MGWVAGIAALGIGIPSQAPVLAQVLFYSPQPDATLIKAQSVQLASDAVRLAQFGRVAEGLNRARLAVQLDPTSADLWLILGSLQLEHREYEASVPSLERAQQLNPQNANVLFTLGEALMRVKDYPRAITTLQAGVAIEASDPNGFFQLGNAFLLQGDLESAKEQFLQAMDLNEQFWPAVNNLGLVAYEQGDVDKAMTSWQAAIQLDDEVAEPRLALATALFIQGKVAEAEAEGIKALQLDPSYGDVETLRINLWGSRLLQDAQVFLQRPRVRDALFQARVTRIAQEEGGL
ncbi:MAG: tetratricopeptide repeat protein [Synechococcales cyanobacterium]